MTRDLVVLPADGDPTPESAREQYEQMSDSVQPPDSPNVIAVAEKLNAGIGTGDDGFLAIEVEPDRRGVVVCIREPLADEGLFEVLDLTRERDLVVFDVGTNKLYNPRGRVDIHVTVGDGTTLPYMTRDLVQSLLGVGDHGGYLIAQQPRRYLHAVRDPRGGYDLEARLGPDTDDDSSVDATAATDAVAGSAGGEEDNRMVARVETLDEAAAAVWEWIRAADGWSTTIGWKPEPARD